MKNQIFLLFTFIVSSVFAQKKDTIWYSSDWRPTTKEKAAFYRPKPIKKGKLYLIRDYYINGMLQMEGYSSSAEESIFEGEVKWYDENGEISTISNFKNNILNGKRTRFIEGNEYTLEYKDGEPTDGKLIYTSRKNSSLEVNHFENGKKTISELFYAPNYNTPKIRNYFDENDQYHWYKKSEFFDKEGKKISEVTYEKGLAVDGNEIDFYNDGESIYSERIFENNKLLYQDTYYKDGSPKELFTNSRPYKTTYFDENKNKLGEIIYSGELGALNPQDGTVFFFSTSSLDENQSYYSLVKTYKDGIVINEKEYFKNGQLKIERIYSIDNNYNKIEKTISYQKDGELIGEMIYDKNLIKSGVEHYNNGIKWFEEGKIIKSIDFYNDSDIVFKQFENNKITYFTKDQKVLGHLETDPSVNSYNYQKPLNGVEFRYINDTIYSQYFYKDGDVYKELSWERDYKSNIYFKNISFYGSSKYYPTKEIRYYSNGRIQSETSSNDKDGKKLEGKYYKMDGTLLGIYDFQKENGTFYEFFRSSDQPKIIKTVKNNSIISEKEYAENYRFKDSFLSRYYLALDYDINSTGKVFDEKGDTLFKILFKDKKPYEGVIYNPSMKESLTFKNGLQNGEYKKYNRAFSYRVMEEGNYLNNKKDGVFKYYDYNGDLTLIQNFVKGKRNGKTTYFKEGKKVSELIYKDDKPYEGVKKEFKKTVTYKDGQIISEFLEKETGNIKSEFKEDKIIRTVYHQNSEKKKYLYETSKSSRLLDGEIIRYDEKGNQQYKAILKNGELISGEILLNKDFFIGDISVYKSKYCMVTKLEKGYELKVFDEKDRLVFQAIDLKGNDNYSVLKNRLYLKANGLKLSDLF